MLVQCSVGVHQIGNGIVSIATGTGGVISIVSRWCAALSAYWAARPRAMNGGPQIAEAQTMPGTPTVEVAAQIARNKMP
jgi:hypothetical protein